MFISGTINSENPGADFYAELADALTSVGYTLVDTVLISTRTHKVWQAPAENAFGEAWFLDVVYETTGPGLVWMVPFEDYNPATNQGFRGPINWHADGLEPDGSSTGEVGYALEDIRWMTPGHPEINWYADECYTIATYPGGDWAYWASVTVDRVAVISSVDSQRIVYAGLFEPSPLYIAQSPGGVTFPLVMGHISPYEYAEDYLSITRLPQNTEADMDFMSVMSKNRSRPIPGKEAGGTPSEAADMWLMTWGGWVGTFYGVAGVPSMGYAYGYADEWSQRVSVARGDLVQTNTTVGSTTASGEWVLCAPYMASGISQSVMLKKE